MKIIRESGVVNFGGKNIKYTLKTSQRTKNIRLTICCNASLEITRPRKISKRKVKRFIIQKEKWILEKINYFKKLKPHQVKSAQASHKNYLKYKTEAFNLINERLKVFNKIYNFQYNRVVVKNQRTIWGSCSEKKNLNFNYKLLFLSKIHRDYIIVHELCHLKELNHSKNFWKLVKITVPNYKDIRRELKECVAPIC